MKSAGASVDGDIQSERLARAHDREYGFDGTGRQPDRYPSAVAVPYAGDCDASIGRDGYREGIAPFGQPDGARVAFTIDAHHVTVLDVGIPKRDPGEAQRLRMSGC